MSDRRVDRRTVLGGLASAAVGATAGCLGSTTLRETGTAKTVDPTEDGLSADERAAFRDRVAQTYGSVAATRLTPDGDPEAAVRRPRLDPTDRIVDDTEQLQRVGEDGDTLVVVDNYVALYETGQTDEDGNDYTLHWVWSAARTTTERDSVRTVSNHVDLHEDAELTTYGPGSDREVYGGTVGPSPEETGQDTDEFGLLWEGENTDTLVITGYCAARRSGDPGSFQWRVATETEP